MQSVLQPPFFRLLSDEFLYNPQFLVASSFESAGIVKDVSVMIGEYKLILDAVLSTLALGSGTTEMKCKCH